MAVLKAGTYIGKYKEGDIYYYQFSPETLAENGKTIYTRVGDREEELISGRSYMLSILNEAEQKLVDDGK